MENYTFYYKTYDGLNGIFTTQETHGNVAFKNFLSHLIELDRDMIDFDCEITGINHEIL
jgi:hypothetical protein